MFHPELAAHSLQVRLEIIPGQEGPLYEDQHFSAKEGLVQGLDDRRVEVLGHDLVGPVQEFPPVQMIVDDDIVKFGSRNRRQQMDDREDAEFFIAIEGKISRRLNVADLLAGKADNVKGVQRKTVVLAGRHQVSDLRQVEPFF